MAKRIIIILLILAIVLCIGTYITAKKLFPLKYEGMIEEQCEKYGFPKDLICAQIFKESRFEADAESVKGAVGLMQIMPETGKWCAEKMGMADFNPEMLKNPAVSLEIGCWYLNYLYEKTENLDFALAAYNGGIANVYKWISKGLTPDQIPFPETREYVRKIENYRKIYKTLYRREMEV